MSEKITIVIPCYNEEARFVPECFLPLLDHQGISLLLVNDGSTDSTITLLRATAERVGDRCQLLDLPHNVGKAEAVRHGLAHAIQDGATGVGYLDADGATSASEMLRLVDAFERTGKPVLLASRVALAGTRINRRPLRHYLGRVFATFASRALGCTVYDTQCGAKLFKNTLTLQCATARPFAGRWTFDVELLGRLLYPSCPEIPPCPGGEWLEVPLLAWNDVHGSKLRFMHMLGMGWELLRIAIAIRRRN